MRIMQNILNLQAMSPITGDQVEYWSATSNTCNIRTTETN
ncbi:hypothetical protein rsdtw13_42650 [Clostridium sp. TW13]|uniref:Uncharacterized protein n=1 Tax=Inconstantimicrobium mannanitabidum TaxID=1604901 RepID=A0ACB5RIU9_9CLOT|nr:hypothetical protein rsdtw13_42650 [Clostridium sp. TW13]